MNAEISVRWLLMLSVLLFGCSPSHRLTEPPSPEVLPAKITIDERLTADPPTDPPSPPQSTDANQPDRTSPEQLLNSFIVAIEAGDPDLMLAHFTAEGRDRERAKPDGLVAQLALIGSSFAFSSVTSSQHTTEISGGVREESWCLTIQYRVEPSSDLLYASLESVKTEDGWYLTDVYHGPSHRFHSASSPAPPGGWPRLLPGRVVSQTDDLIVLEIGAVGQGPPIGTQVDLYRVLERAMENVGPAGSHLGVAIARVVQYIGTRVTLEVTYWPSQDKPDGTPWDHFVKGRELSLEWREAAP